MKTLTVVCSLAVFALSCLIVVTEGIPAKASYALFTLLIIVVPLFTAFVVVRPRFRGEQRARIAVFPRIAAWGNVVLLGFVGWALVTQYPYPEGVGVIPFGVLALLTPVLSLAVLRRHQDFVTMEEPDGKVR
jgi:hypothetical protein